MKMHSSITTDRVLYLARLSMFGDSMTGLCIRCGDEQEGVEPDAERLQCESCGKQSVYGAEQLVLLTVA